MGFNASIWGNLEDIRSNMIEVADDKVVDEQCGSQIRVIMLALEQVQQRLENRDRRETNGK